MDTVVGMGRGVVPTDDGVTAEGVEPLAAFCAEYPSATPVVKMMETAFRGYVAGTPATRKLSALNALVHADAALDWLVHLGVRAETVANVATAILAPLALSRPGLVQVLGVPTSTVYKAHNLIQGHYGADAKARIRFHQLRDPSWTTTEGRDPVVASGAAEFRAWVAKYGPNPAAWQPEFGSVQGPRGQTVSAKPQARPVADARTEPPRPSSDFDMESPAPEPILTREPGRDPETIKKTGHSRFKT